ncbi:MAG: hypothetical protein CL623_03945 [Arcobacter sp.]|nr:hypothetical protein [Arcobacter sp.]|tara:strand:+ start:1027 stop:1350 length:324 start_codon:yes stop_codon:yes gene_type:complete
MLNKLKQSLNYKLIRYTGLLVLIFGVFMILNYKDKDMGVYLLLGGGFFFFASFLWLWILSIAATGFYFFIEFVSDLSHNLFGNALIDFFLILIVVMILEFLTAEPKD